MAEPTVLPMEGPALRLLLDARLSDSARVLGLYIYQLGEGEHEIDYDVAATVLHGCPSKETVRRNMRQLELHGYVEKVRNGGRGHSNVFRFIHEEQPRGEKVHTGEGLSDYPHTTEDLSDKVHNREGLSDSVHNGEDLSGKVHTDEDLNALTRDDEVRQLEREGDSLDTPSVVSPTDLDARAAEAIAQHNGLLDGCRGSLRDYLADRVPPEKQFGYVQRVATMLRGFGFNWDPLGSGAGIPPPKRPGLVAAALNELLATGERDVASPAKPMKWPDGDPRNLITKLEILIKQSNREDGYAGRSRQRNGDATQKARGGEAPEWVEEYAHLGG